MTVLHLVRHGPPAVDPAVPPQEWSLRPDAADAVKALGDSGVLPRVARWFSSTEPKAVQTARLLTRSSTTSHRPHSSEGLREAERPAHWFEDAAEFEAVVRRSLDQPDAAAYPGWEPASATRGRVAAATRGILHSCPDDDVVLVGHGTAWTLLVAELTDTEPDIEAWRAMRMPDHCVIDVAVGRVVSAWGRWS